MSNKLRKALVLAGALLASAACFGQHVAIKSNLLYDAMTTPNLGLECSTNTKQSVSLVYGFNPWKFGKNHTHYAKHWVLMPEYRWWLCSVYNGHFFGVHAMTGEFNARQAYLPIPGGFFGGDNITAGIRKHRYEGTYAGIGATYGYQWAIHKHWNIECEIGVGYNHVWYEKYNCGECGNKEKFGHSNYVGLTKLGVSILYLF